MPKERGSIKVLSLLAALLVLATALFDLLPSNTNKVSAATGGTIRQEINILNSTYTATAAAITSTEVAQLNTTQYSGAVSYYFEVDASVTAGATGSVRLRRFGTTTDDATFTTNNLGTSVTRYRTPSAFTPPSGSTTYFVYVDSAGTSRTVTLKAARIIAIQNSDPLTSTETQIEIGSKVTALSNTSAAPLTNPKYWKYTAANWDGSPTFTAQAAVKTTGTVTVILQEDNGAFANWANKITIGTSNSSTTTLISNTFTPTDGRNYRIAAYKSAGGGSKTYDVYNAKIIVDQAASYSVVDSYPSANIDGGENRNLSMIVGQSFTGNGQTLNNVQLYLMRGGNPSGNVTVSIYAHSGTFGSSSLPTGSPLAISDPVTVDSFDSLVFSQVTFTFSGSDRIILANGVRYTLVYSQPDVGPDGNYVTFGTDFSSPTHAGNYFIGDDTASAVVDAARDLIFYVNSAALPSHLEPQYLLLNTADSNVVGQQGYITRWDTSEWTGTSNTYKFAIDSDNAANSAKLQDKDNGNADVAGSTVTGVNQQISGAMTMPATGHNLDVYVANTTGVITSARIIAVVTMENTVVSVSVSDGGIAYGVLGVNTSKSTTSSDLNDTQTASNDGTAAEDFNIKGLNSANWALAAAAGADQYKHEFCTSGTGSPDPCDTSPTWTTLTSAYQPLAANIASAGTKRFDLKITTPTSTNATSRQTVSVIIQAVAH